MSTILPPVPAPRTAIPARNASSPFPSLHFVIDQTDPKPFSAAGPPRVVPRPLPNYTSPVPPPTATPPAAEIPEFFAPPIFGDENQPAPEIPVENPAPSFEPGDFTDADLFAALAPLFPTQDTGGITASLPDFEPMLRTTIRHTLAERSPSNPEFLRARSLERFLWHMQALFTSRTYEDIVFEKTRRFRIEEVYLFEREKLSLVSFASADPARHSAPRRVESTAQRIALHLQDGKSGGPRTHFSTQDSRGVLAITRAATILVAVTRGTVPEIVLVDLEYIHKSIENRFAFQIVNTSEPLLRPLQPFLEDCLLIQAPAAAT